MAEDTESFRKQSSIGDVSGIQTADLIFPGDLTGSRLCRVG